MSQLTSCPSIPVSTSNDNMPPSKNTGYYYFYSNQQQCHNYYIYWYYFVNHRASCRKNNYVCNSSYSCATPDCNHHPNDCWLYNTKQEEERSKFCLP